MLDEGGGEGESCAQYNADALHVGCSSEAVMCTHHQLHAHAVHWRDAHTGNGVSVCVGLEICLVVCNKNM